MLVFCRVGRDCTPVKVSTHFEMCSEESGKSRTFSQGRWMQVG